MRKIEPLAALGMWMLLGIAADGMETTQMIWPGWSQEADIQDEEGNSGENDEEYTSEWEKNQKPEKTDTEGTGGAQEKETDWPDDIWTGEADWLDDVWAGEADWPDSAETGIPDRADHAEKQKSEKKDGTDRKTEDASGTERAEKKIRISAMRVAEESRYYDGTTAVKIDAEVTGLPDNMTLTVIGKAERRDAGTWPVETEIFLEGPDRESYSIETEENRETMTVTILPKPLQITISDARKPYGSENRISELIFEEKEYLKVTGFLEEDCKNGEVPEGFVFPELTIDEGVLQKNSPMYQKGKLIRYQNAVVPKLGKDGNISGNATANYTFNIEENRNSMGGNVTLCAPEILEGRDYIVQCTEEKAHWKDTDGRHWIRKGEELSVIPLPESTFTDGARIGQIHADGTAEITLSRRDSQGEILAESQFHSISWYADDSAPEAEWALDGIEIRQGEESYRNGETTVSCVHISDSGSGVGKVELYAAYEEEKEVSPEELYRRHPDLWQEGTELTVSREGVCRVWSRMEDRVGNTRYQCTGEIVTDHTVPGIRFENIASGSANRKKVEPVCVIKDKNLDKKTVKVTLDGFRSGIRKVQWEREESEKDGTFRIKMKNLPEEKDWDDVYTLMAEVQDMAGNQSSREIRFSVNRFGSVYYLDDKTKEQTDPYYLPYMGDLKIYEVNVDELTESELILGYEGNTRQLVKDRDYTVRKTGDDQSWKEYCYTISSGCFEEEGMYYVICASKDRARNSSDNRMRKQKIEFAVDRSGPEIMLSGVEKDQIYREAEKKVQLECRDNLAMQEVTVWVNGEKIRQNREAEQEIPLEKEENWQTIRVMATDRAGNRTDTGEICFWMNDQKEAVPLTEFRRSKEYGKRGMEYQQGEEGADNGGAEAEKTGITEEKKVTGNSWEILMGTAITAGLGAIFFRAKRHK